MDMKPIVGIVSKEYVLIENVTLGIFAYVRGLTASEKMTAATQNINSFDVSTNASEEIQIKAKEDKKKVYTNADYAILFGLRKEDPWNLTDSNGVKLSPTLENIGDLYDEIHTWLFKEIHRLSKIDSAQVKN